MTIDAFEIEYHAEFDKEMNRFIVKKKFKKLPGQIRELVSEFETGNFSGTLIMRKDSPIECEIYKVRLPNEDTNVGKSNGYRVIYFAASKEKLVVLLAIYYKKEKPSISESYITALIDGYFLNSLPEEDWGSILVPSTVLFLFVS